jgi:UDP-2-acetamido-3-amino-2,3-dideoxy-glucuronate N-acetyltransferase
MPPFATTDSKPYFVHESAYVDDGAEIGEGTKVWHFCHIMKGAKIGQRCIFGQNVNVDGGVVIGSNVKVQNNVSIYTGTIVEDDVFLGPSCVLTNVTNPRSQINRHSLYEKTMIRRGATIGANATVVCGITIGRYAFIAAGAVIAKDVPDYGFMIGAPARHTGWMSRHGHILKNPDTDGIMVCPESGLRYQLLSQGSGLETARNQSSTAGSSHCARQQANTDRRAPTAGFLLRCLDLDEEASLPPELAVGKIFYDELKGNR